MAEFNPQIERKHEETYLASRPAMAPEPLARPPAKLASNAIADFGNIFLGAINAADVVFKDRIQQQMTADVDAIRDQAIGAGFTQADPAGEPPPPDLEKQLSRATRVVDAHRAGKMSEKHYIAQLENIARATRSRYPGHRAYIDSVMSSLVGFTPANALARLAVKEASSGGAAEGRRLQLEKDLARIGEYNFTDDELAAMTDRDLLRVLNNYNKAKILREENKAAMEAEITAGNLSDKQITARASSDVFRALSVDGELVQAQQAFNQMRSTLLDDAANSKLNEEVHKTLLVSGQRIVNRRMEIASEILNQPEYLQYMNAKDRQDILENIQKEGQHLIQGIASKNYTAADIFGIRNQTIADADKNLVLSIDSTGQIRLETTLSGQFPEMYKTWVARNPEFQLSSPADQALSDAFRHRVLDSSQNTYSLNDHSKNLQGNVDRGSISDKSASAILENDTNKVIEAIANPGYPISWKQRAAKALFGPENRDFLGSINPEDSKDKSQDRQSARHQMFMRLLSPEVARGMKEIEKVDPSLYQQYNEWKNFNFNALYRTELNDMKHIVVNRQSMNLEIDPETGRINIEPIAGQGGVWENLAGWWTGAKNSVDRMNMAIDAMRPGWEVDGRNPVQEVNRLFSMGGVDISAEKGRSFPDTVFEFFTNAFEKIKAGPEGGGPLSRTGRFLDPQEGSFRERARRNMGLRDEEGNIREFGSQRMRLTPTEEGNQRLSDMSRSDPQLTPREGTQKEIDETLDVIRSMNPDDPDQDAIRKTALERLDSLIEDMEEIRRQEEEWLNSWDRSLQEIAPLLERNRGAPTS